MFLGKTQWLPVVLLPRYEKKYKQTSTDFSVSVTILCENIGHKMSFH
jgi:hypothetical protein